MAKNGFGAQDEEEKDARASAAGAGTVQKDAEDKKDEGGARPALFEPNLEFEDDPDDPRDQEGYTLRARLREETEAPFRKVRLFLYYASAASASVGGFISGARVIAGLSGVSGAQPLSETVPNTLIDLGVIAIAVLLIRLDNKAGKKRLDRLSRGAALAALKVEISRSGKARSEESLSGKMTTLSSFRLYRRPVIVCGNADTVNAVLAQADPLKEELAQRDIIVIPYITGGGDNAVLNSWSKGEWLATPVMREKWAAWFQKELELSKLKPSDVRDKALVLYTRKDGRVGGRTIGMPNWNKMIEGIDNLPKSGMDRLGRP
ncbi:Protein LOW PSII ACCUMULATION 1, chloroplastic [Porphyridium purpureum]|uniref:Protein LOW PSII ACCUMULATION 1, chloroplastic n=1 Tax=Porphyridium purpureum TaxID=35688 RepID=A0A5J4Z0L1_PORPP|nr:Protein LOW PSII ACCUMULATION 1, chloroplastic [Porphyridium purpureum]|eukprot:POR6519..scf208_2